ncbi:MAG TPA: IS110 family transposase [Herpetosiphonaceae bacterium]|nr:IS110 family transposase [Herpetosiphonaceae bacterium]
MQHKPVSTIGIDLAKRVFQVHGVGDAGEVVLRRGLRRSEVERFFARLAPCLIGIEACPTAHHVARLLRGMRHQVRLIPPAYVKPYVRRQKNDMADAAAICEAVTRPSMRFVPIKSTDQQAALMLHKTRELLVGQRTALINALRSHMAEFGLVAAQGPQNIKALIGIVADADDTRIPALARAALQPLVVQLASFREAIAELDAKILACHKASETSRRLASIPGVGPLTASLLAAKVTDPSLFANGREFAAWLGLVPRQTSSGGKERLGHITKMGDRMVRRLLVVGAHAVLYRVMGKADGDAPHADPLRLWAKQLIARKPFKLVAVALANKMARIAWALLAKGSRYGQQPEPAAA